MRVLDLHVPDAIGADALHELDEVDWRRLDHAYGTDDSVRPALRLLGVGSDEALHVALEQLFGSICHQGGTIYEASAYAFPFIAAWSAGAPLVGDAERAIVALLGSMAWASASDDGGHEIHRKWMREAIVASAAHLQVVATRSPKLRQLVDAMLPTVNERALDVLMYPDEQED